MVKVGIGLLAITVGLWAGSYVSPVRATWTVNSRGQVVNQNWGQVLGEQESEETEAAETTNRGQAVRAEQQERQELRQAEAEAESEEAEEEVEVETRTEKLTRETLRIQVKNNRLELTADGETESQEEYELEAADNSTESSVLEIEERAEKFKTKIRAQNNAAYVIRNRVAAKTNFPLMVNLETNELMVMTPKGTKVVTVLPDAAVQHMLTANVLDQLGGKGGLAWLEYQAGLVTPTPTPSATPTVTPIATVSATPEPEVTEEPAMPSATPTPIDVEPVNEVVELSTDAEGGLVYRIQGLKNKKLLFFYPVQLTRTALVSAETGELVGIEQDRLTKILDLLSV